MDNVIGLRAVRMEFDLDRALLAARSFDGLTMCVATVLAAASSQKGVVMMTAEEIARRVRRSRVSVLPHVRELVEGRVLTSEKGRVLTRDSRGGLLARDPKISYLFTWKLERVEEFAIQVLEEDRVASQELHLSPESCASGSSRSLRLLWIDQVKRARAATDRYKAGGVFLGREPQPIEANWLQIEEWTLAMVAKTGETAEVIVKFSCRVYVQLNDEKLIQNKHILSFVTRELANIQPRVMAILEGKRKTGARGSAPAMSLEEIKRQARGFAAAAGGAR